MNKDKHETKLWRWFNAATREEEIELAKECGTSRAYLYHISRGYGARYPSVALALAIQDATTKLHYKTDGRLPIVSVRDLVSDIDMMREADQQEAAA